MSKTGIFGSELAGADMPVVGDYAMAGGTNGFYAGPPPWLTFTGAAMGANVLYFCPIILPYDRTITDILVSVSGAVAGNGRVGLYRMRANSMLPGKLIVDAGTVDTGTANVDRRLTVNQKLAAGIYLGATVFDAAAQMRRIAGNLGIGPWLPNATAITNVAGFSRAFTYGVLPTDETAEPVASYSNATPTLVFIK